MTTPQQSLPGRLQTFLIGESLYFRPVRYDDAPTAAIWLDSPFPLPEDQVRARLKRQLEVGFAVQSANQLLIACRRRDDRIVGSATVAVTAHRSGEITFHLDPLLATAVRGEIAAELASILVGWLLEERDLKWAAINVPVSDPDLRESMERLGGRLAIRLRDASFRSGRRTDMLCWQFFHPVWRGLLGDPPDAMTSDPRQAVWPHAAAQAGRGNVTPAAFEVGSRVYLRPFEPDESIAVGETWLQETEHYLPGGRTFGNPHTFAHVHRSMTLDDPPNWIRMGCCLRETNELIGIFGLRAIDWINKTAESQSGIFLDTHRGQGIGLESKRLLLDYAFNRLGLRMIWARVEEGNSRSATALRRQGYRDAGYLAWTNLNHNGMCGSWFFDLLVSEWRESIQ